MKLDQKYNQDAIREFWNMMQGADAVLVLNYDKHGIPNYIGGNTLMEIGFAHVLNQKILRVTAHFEIMRVKLLRIKNLLFPGLSLRLGSV